MSNLTTEEQAALVMMIKGASAQGMSDRSLSRIFRRSPTTIKAAIDLKPRPKKSKAKAKKPHAIEAARLAMSRDVDPLDSLV